MKRLVLISALAFISACASTPKKAVPAANDKEQAQFDDGMRALEAQNYMDAANIFDTLLLQHPGTELDLVTLFNSGAAYEGMGDCKKAEERYRQTIRSSAGKYKRIENEAYFRLSLTYECLGSDAKTVTALLDARRRGAKDLGPERLSTEIPARLAAAYNRLGNRERAVQYFNEASRGLKVIVARGSSRPQLEQLARTLYLMGKLNASQRKGDVPPSQFMSSLSMQQPFLLQALEVHVEPFSSKAEEDLRTAYDNIFRFSIPDPKTKREFLTRVLQTLNELKNIRMPKPDKIETQLFDDFARVELKVQNEIATLPSGNPLTDEAQKRNGIKQKGRLVDPGKGK